MNSISTEQRPEQNTINSTDTGMGQAPSQSAVRPTSAEQKPDQNTAKSIDTDHKQPEKNPLASKWEKRLIFVVGILFGIVPIILYLWSKEWLLPIASVCSAISGTAICIWYFYQKFSNILKVEIEEERDAHIVNLHLNFRLATMVGVLGSVLLGFFGIQTFASLKQAATESLRQEIDAQKARVDTLKKDSQKILQIATKSIDSLNTIIQNSTEVALSRKLKHVVVAYAGPDSSLAQGWRICESTLTKGLFGKMVLGDPEKPARRMNGNLSGQEREFYIDILRNTNADIRIISADSLSAHRLRYIVYESNTQK